MNDEDDIYKSVDIIRSIVEDALISNDAEYLTLIITKILTEYIELAQLSTDGNYEKNWTHSDVLNYLTYGE
tara:strand:- start:607 stop:819 length:213 start_codon:yes stop_codon:yes gene_type:complete